MVAGLARRVPDRFRVGITRFEPKNADEADEVAAWWRERFGEVWLEPARNAWLYEKNPCLGDDGPGPWICRRKGAIVGQQGEVPFDLQLGPEVHRASWAVDLEVDEGWRLKGVGPALIATLLEARPIVCSLDLSDEGYAAFKGAGAFDLGTVGVYRRPLDPRRVVRMAGVPAIVQRLAPVVAPVARLLDGALAASVRLRGAKLVAIDRFDERVDDVWDAAHPFYGALARRDLAALAWRIDERADRDRLLRYYLVRRGRTLGYVVLRPSASADERTVVVVDYLAPPRWVAPLLLLAGRAAHREHGAVAMSVKTRNVQADRSLRLAGFVNRRMGHDHDRRFMVNTLDEGERAVPAEVVARLHDTDGWFVTGTDSNLEFAAAPSEG
jgi:hypothetical protein